MNTPLVIFKILGLFVNTLNGDEKYYLVNRDNLTQHIQMALPKKQRTFSEFFTASLKLSLNFEYLKKKDDHHSRWMLFWN